eukprot:1897123-Rhodomonas_salina.2
MTANCNKRSERGRWGGKEEVIKSSPSFLERTLVTLWREVDGNRLGRVSLSDVTSRFQIFLSHVT